MSKVLIKPESSDQYGHLASEYEENENTINFPWGKNCIIITNYLPVVNM